MIFFESFFIAFFFMVISSLFVNCESDYETSVTKFLTWFKSNGGFVDGVTIMKYSGMGQGVHALKKIEENSKMLYIPHKLIVSHKSLAIHVQSNNKYFNILSSLSSSDFVIAFLMIEFFDDSDSFFQPYFDLLPRYVPSLLHFSKKELEELQSDDLLQQALNEITSVRKSYQDLVNIVQKDLAVSTDDFLIKYPFEKYLWATSIVNSRGLRFRGVVYLAPFADMFNYEPHENIRQSGAGDFFLKHHILDDEGLLISADRSHDENAQVYEDYGDNKDEIYLT
jgi:hypothetical protein